MKSEKTSGLRYLIIAFTLLIPVYLHSYHYSGRGYRMDEIHTLYHSIVLPFRQMFQLALLDGHPPAYRVLLYGWIHAFGHHEAVVRYGSSLLTLLALAGTIRLGVVLFDWRTGIWAAGIMGLLPVMVFHGHESRPYTLLVSATALNHLAFYAYLRRQTGLRAFAYVMCGLVVVYSHYFGAYLMMGQAVFLLIFVRWHLRLYSRLVGFFVVLALALGIGWGGSIAYTLSYLGESTQRLPSNLMSLAGVYWTYSLKPAWLNVSGLLVVLVLFFWGWWHNQKPKPTPPMRRGWQYGYLVIFSFGIIALMFVINAAVPMLAYRRLMVILPGLALLWGYGLARIPGVLQVVVAGILLGTGWTTFIEFDPQRYFNELPNYLANNGYQPQDALIITGDNHLYHHAPATYYLRHRMNTPLPEDALLYLWHERDDSRLFFPYYPTYSLSDFSARSQAVLRNYLGTRERVWVVEGTSQSLTFNGAFHAWLARRYTLAAKQTWERDLTVYLYVLD